MRENCNNLCKEVGIVRSKPARWTIFARRERHREGFENVRVSQKNKGAHLHRTLKTKRVGGNSEQGRNLSQRAGREEPEQGSLGTWEGSEQGVVGVRTREESEQREVGFRTREVVAAACTSGSAALTGSWETGGGRSPGPPTRSRYLIFQDYLVSSPPQTWSSPWSGALRQPGPKKRWFRNSLTNTHSHSKIYKWLLNARRKGYLPT